MPTVCVDICAVRKHQANIEAIAEHLELSCQLVGQPLIVLIEERDERAARKRHSSSSCVPQSPILLADDPQTRVEKARLD